MEATQLQRGPAPRRRAPRIGFGIYVREARRAMGMSQAEFAALIGVGESRLSAWETGRNNPEGDRAELAELLEERTGYSRAYFMGWGDMPSPDPGITRFNGGSSLSRKMMPRRIGPATLHGKPTVTKLVPAARRSGIAA